MSIYLTVRYEQKDTAKAAGARWDAARKQWFFPGDELPETLRRFHLASNPAMVLRCRCGNTGRAGDYPFSTLPGSGRCDDCV